MEINRGLGKKGFLDGPETHPDILCVGHRNQYQLKNAIKSGGTIFLLFIFAILFWGSLKF